MVQRRTVDLLPEIFRTDANKQVLSATLDQLIQEPSIKRTRGYVGRRVGPGVNPADNYVSEPTAERNDYQLEPGVVFLRPNTQTASDVITYPGMIDALNLQGADVARQDRLWQSQYYAWDPLCDLDKFTNYSQYYWLPGGGDSVDVSSSEVPLTDDFTVTRTDTAYNFSGYADNNPIITLVRGGNYRFTVNQPGSRFWIQTDPGINGRIPATPNISSRDVLGVINNGEDQGTVQFDVPLKTAQDFYYGLNNLGSVDLVTNLKFNEINNVYVSTFLSQHPEGIDGITNLDGRTVVFLNRTENAQDGGWQVSTQFDPLPRNDSNNGLPGSYDTTTFDQTTDITSQAQRYSIWQIQYIFDDADQPFIRLSSVLAVPELSKFHIAFGTEFSSTQWYKDASGYFERIPLLTAVLDTLWYQDSTNPEIFGQIKLVDVSGVQPIDLEEIIGAKNYTSPNGVVFTNGLKVQFRGLTHPAEYQDLEYYVEGVGTGPGLAARVGFVDGEAYYGPFHVHQGRKMTGARHTESFHQYIYDTITESLANLGAGGPPGAPLPTVSQPGAVDGNGIVLVPVRALVTPETYTRSETIPYDFTSYDSTPYDASLNAPLVPDYLTINRASKDRNAWSRSNRWVHEDVIKYAAGLNNTTAVFDNNFRGKRPIVEFRANIKLFNFGTQGKIPVNIIDFNETDALSNINGSTGYSTQGYTFIDGTLVIFANDLDLAVRNRIYRVDFINPDGNPASPDVINLVPIAGGEAFINQTVVSLSGLTDQGKSYWFDGNDWVLAQQKTGVNQAPLFDVFDRRGRSYSDRTFYPSSTFAGSKLFGYALGGTTATDVELGFALKYLNIDNVGDIVFENYLYTDTFVFVEDNVGVTLPISDGFVREYIDSVSFSNVIGWLPAAAQNRSRQVFRFDYDGNDLVLDIKIDTASVFAPLQVFVGGVFFDPTRYIITTTDFNTFVQLPESVPAGTIVEVQAISDQTSSVAFYQVPLNLENNPLNENSNTFTLGTIRTHYETIGQNLRNIQGPINGANNTRDLGNILPYGDNIVQHSAPLVLAGTFLRYPQWQIFDALTFNSQEYEKYKARLIDLAGRGDFVNLTPTQILDTSMQELSLPRSDLSPFYWSDMIPSGETYTELTYTYSVITTSVFDLTRTYDFTRSNYQGLLIYVNGNLLTKNYDYEVAVDAQSVTLLVPLAVGDVIKIREYASTVGSFVPNTPTKMGLYSLFRPAMYLDETYVNPTMVIRGHDGSITVAYGDDRDAVLLEFETRIYNNMKIDSAIPLQAEEIMPGQFRTTDYSLNEINTILSKDFLAWIGWNKLDYTTQAYLSDNAFTYNYSQSSDKLTGQPLLGAWRGIYDFVYDTTAPDSRPWEMLGFSEEPDWWQNTYGPAPYTSGNMVLWDDLAAGLVRDPVQPYVLPLYARPDLSKVIPVGSEGELLDPLQSVVGNYNSASFRRSWTFGDDGPVENSWRTSSAYPFAIMKLMALTKPAKFFSLFADRDRYQFDANLNQYLWDGRFRLDANLLAPLYGDGISRASYINWIIDYNRQLGDNSTAAITELLDNTDVRLCWRTAAFTDKSYLKIFTERSTPNSLNTSLLLPDESYQILLYKNQAFERSTYSSVIVQRTDLGWAVLGYSSTEPYFNILVSKPNGLTTTVSGGSSTVRVAVDHSDQVVQVPYGYVFTNRSAVCDFLISYGKLLTRQGFTFDAMENGYVLNWQQMATEFLYWSDQGWSTGSMINLNPVATTLTVTRPGAVADSLVPPRLNNIILNQNRQAIPPGEVVINRLDNKFQINIIGNSSNTINYLNLDFTAYEHMVVLDNRSIFADLIYDPATGARQNRVLVSGSLSGDWNGTVNAPGFVINENNIRQWVPNQTYAKGEIVLFKNEYWAASTIIQPGQQFDYSQWVRSDYQEIQQGLLPNAANSSDLLQNSYSIYNANLEREVDLFSYGLIGFRPREYMQSLNLDDVSQVNLYQQFLGTKGTIRSAELFSLADLGKEVAEYNIYEYWAILQSVYGANANRSYFELLLNESRLQSDPSIIQVIEPGQISEADQTVLVQDIWKSSYKIPSPNILPTISTSVTDRSFPTAGYVNFDDVDFAVFDIDSITTQELANIGIGDKVWVAAQNNYDWNVYRCTRVDADIIEVTDNLDGSSLVTFTRAHDLVVGQELIIRFFSPAIDGAYRVVSVPSLTTVTIAYQFLGFQTTEIGTGVGMTLQTARVAQASDTADLNYALTLTPGAKVWVDNNGQGLWTVLEKIQPFAPREDIQAFFRDEGSLFGSAVSQGFSNLTAFIGAPGYNPDDAAAPPGALYAFVKADTDEYEQARVLIMNAANTQGYGNAVDVGAQSWAVVGASESNDQQGYAVTIFSEPASSVFEQRQVLTAPDLEFGKIKFGHAVTMSQDERWMYVAAPGGSIGAPAGQVYAYGRVDVQSQSVSYITDGITFTYNWANHIKVSGNQYQQFVVVLNNRLLTFGVDYTVGDTIVQLASVPLAGQELIISRLTAIQLDQRTYDNVAQNSTSGTGTGARFTVNRVRGDYTVVLTAPGIDYTVSDTLTINAATIGGGSSPANDLVITVTEIGSGGEIVNFTQSGSGVDNTTVFALDTFLATVNNIWSFTVRVNDVFYRPEIDYDFNTDSTLEFTGTVPPPGAIILVTARSHFTYVSVLTDPGNEVGAEFGYSVSTTTDGRSLMVGAPGADDTSGRAFVFDRSVERFQVTQSGPNQQFTTVRTLISPTAVRVNGDFLLNTDLNIGGTFTVDSANEVTILSDLQVGDIVEIETNQFNFVQEILPHNRYEGARFGEALDQCVNNCSLYIAAPYDGSMRPEAGLVEYTTDQARSYGTITSTIANPVLTPGDYIRVNNYFVECTGTTVQDLVDDIDAAAIPNVTAATTSDLTLIANGTDSIFDIGTIYSAADSYTTVVYSRLGTTGSYTLLTAGVDYTYNNDTQQITFTNTPLATTSILVVSGRLVLSITNPAAAQPLNKLLVSPGTGTVWQDLGMPVHVWQQTIVSPVLQDYAHFGQAVFVSDNTTTLVVGAPDATLIRPTTFDRSLTYFDANSTDFADPVTQSGVVYTYDFLPSASTSVLNPGQFVFGQQIFNNSVQPLDRFGTAVDLTTGTLLAGAPGSDFDDSQANYGRVIQLRNDSQLPSWQIIRLQQPVVDIALLNSIFIYNVVVGGTNQYLDYFDPLQGRLLGAVQQNIDFIGAIDPASYNVGPINNRGSRWAQERVGQIWWNTARVRFVDPNQDDPVYASRRWGQVFPGSQVDVYQWVSSSAPPALYTGPGTPLSTESFVIVPSVDEQGIFRDIYYFWVSGIRTIARSAGKTLSIETLERYIENPRSSGIAYVAPLSPSTLAIYNALEYISAEDTVLHVEFDKVLNDAAVHAQFQLVPENRANGFLSQPLYRKLQDSLCGVDTAGNLVPDPLLPPSEQYGIDIRPRQSMFVNRFRALENYLGSANQVLANIPISENRVFGLLNSSDPEPSLASGAWNKRVANYEELTYQDLAVVPLGYRYLVSSDSTNNGLWTIYEVQSGVAFGSKILVLIRVQTYDTRQYWRRLDWYQPGYDVSTRILLEVPVYSSLLTLTVPVGSSVKVSANAQGKWEIYQLSAENSWIRVALQDGTIQFDARLWDYRLGRFGFDVEVFDAQYFDQEPVIETRKIIQSINQEIFVGDLLIERNRLLILMFNYILSEQISPAWLTKTSLIDVEHVIRELVPFQIYRQDNQDFVLQYINEVKPYHSQIREFSLIYQGSDIYQGTVNDFDLPAYWDAAQNLFVSPVLDNSGTLSTTSSLPSTAAVWQTFPWNQWYQSYLLEIESVTVVDGGSGYTVPPQVQVTGESIRPAVMRALVNSAGRVTSIEVLDPGQGYTTTAIITLEGGNGTGARAVAVMGNQLVRSITTTIKYDRYQYSSNILTWTANVAYSQDTMVRYDDRVWSAKENLAGAASFEPDDWNLVAASSLSGVDRTMGFYVPDASEPGLDLALLISGVDYPGVQVFGPLFSQNTGFDVGNYDINPYDNISFGPEGLPSYDPAILDAIYESEFTDPYLGTLPAPAYAGDPPTTGPAGAITVDGGAFVDTYSSHAPEELIPGAIFDTLDMRVFTTPGADWQGDGHGFPTASIRYLFDSAEPALSFDSLLPFPVSIDVFNVSNGLRLAPVIDYTADWVNRTVTILQNIANGEIASISVSALGGGNQLFSNTYVGSAVGNSITVPREFDLISAIIVFVNGVQVTNFTYAQSGFNTVITFATTWTSSDRITLTVFGEAVNAPQSWSTPITQYIVSDGSLSYVLTNSLQGTNPANIIVTRNGVRARPSEGIEYLADGSSLQYFLPDRGGYSQGLISDNDVSVYLDNQSLILGVDFLVDPWDGSSRRTITLIDMPEPGSRILISVRTAAQYWINGNLITFLPAQGLSPQVGDIIGVTTFNDTSEQNILTQVFVGPETQGVLIQEPYDSTTFDEGNVTGGPGSYDFGTGSQIEVNVFETGREIIDPERLVVSLNGTFLFEDQGFVTDGSRIIILGAPIGTTAVLAVTQFTESTVPRAIAFRIFQDMRGLQQTYRITDDSSTVLTQPLSATADIIYVQNASNLDEPNLAQGIFGIITIDGERITYRTRNTGNNTLTGLRRGTAGTAAADHVTGAVVYSLGQGNLVPAQYQNRIVFDNFLANGVQTQFVAESINVEDIDSTELIEAVRVYVGGILQTTGYTLTGANPVTVVFAQAPTSGYQVSIRVERALSWYEPGPTTPSNGRPLQITDTQAARFIREV